MATSKTSKTSHDNNTAIMIPCIQQYLGMLKLKNIHTYIEK